MDTFAPVHGLDALDAHLDELLAATTTTTGTTATTATTAPSIHRPPLQAALLDSVRLQLTPANTPALAPRLLPKLVAVLRQQPRWQPVVAAAAAGLSPADEATLLADLATRLLAPVSFADVLALAAEDDLVGALGPDAAAATSLLAMTVLHKAVDGSDADRAAHLARLASMHALLTALVTRWLAAPAVEVGEKGGRVLGDLLDVDCPWPPPPGRRPLVNGTTPSTASTAYTVHEPDTPDALPTLRRVAGPGHIWHRLVRDGLLVEIVTGVCAGAPDDDAAADTPSRVMRTIAQGRVLRLVPRLAAMDMAALQGPTASPAAAAATTPALLPFVALRMVDHTDQLMHLSLIDFFEVLVSVMRLAAATPAVAATAVPILQTLLADATADDVLLADALRTLPDRTVPDEAAALRQWLHRLLPPAPRVGGWE